MQNIPQRQDAERYSPLDQQNDEIRVLILQPGAEADEVHCSLETYQLENCREFEALSYAWGDPNPVEPIFVDGARVLIAHNLSVALRHLRSTHSCRVLWIDAVCINQSDIDERNHQVFMMNRVYSGAKQVLIWLGETRGDSDFAMKRLREIGEGQNVTTAERIALISLVYDCLIDREWWGRLWVVQEVVLAKSDPTILCGHSSVSWDVLQNGFEAEPATRLLSLGDNPTRKLIQRYNQRTCLQHLRDEYQNWQISEKSTPSLARLLHLTKDFETADPRDKVYGCLGLLSTREREIMKPDYKKPAELVFLEATKHLLEHDYQLGPYSCFSVSRDGGGLLRTAASWIPDFSTQNHLNPTDPGILAPKAHIYGADCGQRNVFFQSQNKILAITGVVLDTIEIVIKLQSDQELLISQIEELELLTRQAVEREVPLYDPRHCFMRLKRSKDIFQVFPGHSNLREQFGVLSGRIKRPLGTASRPERALLWIINSVLPGMHFFVTSMGFFGMTGANVRKGDIVSFLFGEQLPIVLRSFGSFYTMLGAANVSDVMNGEIIGMYQRGLVGETTFFIR